MNEHVHAETDLTKNQSLVMGALNKSGEPLSAYTLLDELRDHGLRTPPQIYRALDKLVEFGLVHRLESLNAFVACRHPDCESHEIIAFMICERCNTVGEITDMALAKRLKRLAKDGSFAMKKATIELRGLCNDCQAT